MYHPSQSFGAWCTGTSERVGSSKERNLSDDLGLKCSFTDLKKSTFIFSMARPLESCDPPQRWSDWTTSPEVSPNPQLTTSRATNEPSQLALTNPSHPHQQCLNGNPCCFLTAMYSHALPSEAYITTLPRGHQPSLSSLCFTHVSVCCSESQPISPNRFPYPTTRTSSSRLWARQR